MSKQNESQPSHSPSTTQWGKAAAAAAAAMPMLLLTSLQIGKLAAIRIALLAVMPWASFQLLTMSLSSLFFFQVTKVLDINKPSQGFTSREMKQTDQESNL